MVCGFPFQLIPQAYRELSPGTPTSLERLPTAHLKAQISSCLGFLGKKRWEHIACQFGTLVYCRIPQISLKLGSPVAPFYPFGGGSPTKIDYRKRYPYSNLSTGGHSKGCEGTTLTFRTLQQGPEVQEKKQVPRGRGRPMDFGAPWGWCMGNPKSSVSLLALMGFGRLL